ncbi:MAG TPA: HAD-IA family hydrolase, partial [Bdellovibrionales bacterium]|nr:HAD-IA family hydrolase [Bdellovibrionales bacterium]
RYLYRKLFKDEALMEEFLANVCNSTWNEKHDAGQAFAKGCADLIALHPQHEAAIRAYFDRWPEMLGGAIDGTVSTLERLRESGRYKLLALSNWSNETFPFALERFSFLRTFETVLLSGKEKLIKPDPKFFALLSTRHGVAPANAVFIDDVEKNTRAAKNLGFNTVLFKEPTQLERELREMGIQF